jgi:hypothetical protein
MVDLLPLVEGRVEVKQGWEQMDSRIQVVGVVVAVKLVAVLLLREAVAARVS